jgi:hypothetical protein
LGGNSWDLKLARLVLVSLGDADGKQQGGQQDKSVQHGKSPERFRAQFDAGRIKPEVKRGD